jgi:hypothetical protein
VRKALTGKGWRKFLRELPVKVVKEECRAAMNVSVTYKSYASVGFIGKMRALREENGERLPIRVVLEFAL